MRRVVALCGRSCLAMVGWRVVGGKPAAARYVLIAAPHTSNWDFVLMMLCGMVLGIWPAWVGKHTLFVPPLGWLARAARGIPVDRDSPHNMVEQLAGQFATRDALVLAMPPEGSRANSHYWRSGFYFVARGAGVPVALGFLDYGRRRGGIGPLLHPGDDLMADMNRVRDFYADKRGRFPQRQGPVRLRIEDHPPADGEA